MSCPKRTFLTFCGPYKNVCESVGQNYIKTAEGKSNGRFKSDFSVMDQIILFAVVNRLDNHRNKSVNLWSIIELIDISGKEKLKRSILSFKIMFTPFVFIEVSFGVEIFAYRILNFIYDYFNLI